MPLHKFKCPQETVEKKLEAKEKRMAHLMTCESHPDILAALVKSALHLGTLSIFCLKFLSSSANAFPKLPVCSSTSDGST
jgi:hypothetical protein